MDKGAKDNLAGSPVENGGGQDAQKDLHSRTGRGETKRKTQERMERRSRKISSSGGSEKMERVGDRQEKMESCCSTGQSPQRAVAPTEEEEGEALLLIPVFLKMNNKFDSLRQRKLKLLIYCGADSLLQDLCFFVSVLNFLRFRSVLTFIAGLTAFCRTCASLCPF